MLPSFPVETQVLKAAVTLDANFLLLRYQNLHLAWGGCTTHQFNRDSNCRTIARVSSTSCASGASGASLR